tara:strand:+ start:3108 stop:4634 length:1527 start_codon:yes stop_codon:yes gene_type:complete
MALRNMATQPLKGKGPTAPRKRFSATSSTAIEESKVEKAFSKKHPLTNDSDNNLLYQYENASKKRFDEIVPFLKKLSEIKYNSNFVEQAQSISKRELGFDLPQDILEKAWIAPLDIKSLFAWCVFKVHEKFSEEFFCSDPLNGSEVSLQAKEFQEFISSCGFHLLDITPCSDGRLAHTIAYALRIPFSVVRRRSHAGALFDIEKTVNRWIKTEHNRLRESSSRKISDSNYLKIVTYHFSSLDPSKQGCAAHGSDDSLAAKEGLQRLLDFRETIEKSFCCGASVDLLLIGIDTDSDAIRVHKYSNETQISLDSWVSAIDIYNDTKHLAKEKGIKFIKDKVSKDFSSCLNKGIIDFVVRILVNNLSQIDYVKNFYSGNYPDAGHAERFIGVGIGFKEVHLRNLTYFSHLDTVEKGSPDLDVGIKIFNSLNISRDLPIPVVIRFDYSGKVPGAKQRAIADCKRVDSAISSRYKELVDNGLLHTFLTVRDRDQKVPAMSVGSSLNLSPKEDH